MNVPIPSSSANAVVTAVSTSSSYASPDTVTVPVVASLVLTIVNVNVSVTEPGAVVLESSVAVTTTVCGPTSALTGVPEITPAVLIVRSPGSPVAV